MAVGQKSRRRRWQRCYNPHIAGIRYQPNGNVGIGLTSNPYRQQDLRKLVRTVAKRAGVNKRVHPHLFRHSLDTNMLIRGAHILAIKQQFGNAFVDTTMIYLHAAPVAMQAQYRFFAPSYL